MTTLPRFAGVRRRVRTPTVLLGAALKAWWNADDLADGVVASWAPRVGGPTPVQATEAAKPIRAATSFNGNKPGVTFDGTDDFLRVDATTNLPTGATPGEIWAVYSWTATNSIVAFRYGGASTGVRSLQRLTGTSGAITDAATTANFFMGSTAGTAQLVSAIFLATSYQARRFGRDEAATTGATLNTSTTRTTIGANNAATAATFWNGVIRHILVTTELTLAQREEVEGWLALDSGLQHLLPFNHPYRWAVAA
jgi:hypothetical protein